MLNLKKLAYRIWRLRENGLSWREVGERMNLDYHLTYKWYHSTGRRLIGV